MQARVTLRRGTWERQVTVEVPSGPCEAAAVVPALHRLSDSMVEPQAGSVSCGPGCGACCRQLVPLTLPEIGYVQEIAGELPPERRRSAERAAERASRVFADGGFGPIHELCTRSGAELRSLGHKWFALGVACPFLVDESCSIHEHRPLICREYLVTSPPAGCATPGRGAIKRLAPPVSVWSRVVRSDTGRPQWLPIGEALRTDRPPTKEGTGPELLASLLAAGPTPSQGSRQVAS